MTRPGLWRPVQLTSVRDLDYVMELIQQAYDYNLKTNPVNWQPLGNGT